MEGVSPELPAGSSLTRPIKETLLPLGLLGLGHMTGQVEQVIPVPDVLLVGSH